jgi:hypothetical protein
VAVSEIILVRAEQTCAACPSQWDAWDMDGHYWYLRFRHGRGTMGRDYTADPLSFTVSYEETGLDGEIGLEEFCERIGVTYAPELRDPALAMEPAP